MTKIYIDGIEVLIEDADKYLQINDIPDEDFSRILEQIKIDYGSYDKWFCYHNTEIPLALLDDIDAVLEDDSIEMRLAADSFICSDKFEIVRVTDESFDEFAAYHDKRNPGMYWTSERVRRGLSRWAIFMLRTDNLISGYILLSMWNPAQSEIFCVEAFDSLQCEALIASAAKFAFDNGKSEVLYMADDNTIGHKAALSVGFAATGFYKGYMIK